MRKYIILFYILFSVFLVKSQEVHSKITIMSGGSVELPFNSYTKIHDGMELANWTRLKILYFDTLSDGSLTAGSNWELLVRANTANIPGDGGISMSLDKVELLVTIVNGSGSETITSPLTITNSDAQIVGGGSNPTGTTINGTTGPNTEVIISYRVGRNAAPPAPNSLLGESPGYYFLDLIFTLKKQ